MAEMEPQLSPASKLPQPLPPEIGSQPADRAAMMPGTPTVPATSVATPTSTPNLPPRPQFSYEDVNVNSMATVGSLCTINEQVIYKA